MTISFRIELNERLYIRDPQATDLGKKIIKHSILLLDEIGFEAFTFKKLAIRMHSTEASVYRYFENKHLLLLYLVSWFWEWVHYLIDINTKNADDPRQQLKIIISTLVFASKENPSIEYVNESILHRLIISEGSKAYHTKAVDDENKEGLFRNYETLVNKVSNVISNIQPDFDYPRTLASNLFEMANSHIYFAQHLPNLTDITVEDEDYSQVEEMLHFFAFSLLHTKS